MLGTKSFRKVFVYISIFSIILQAIAPFSYVQLSSKAYAQEATPTPTDTVTPTPIPIESGQADASAPTPTPDTTVPTPTETPVPTDTTIVEPTPVPTDTPTPTSTPVDNLSPPTDSSLITPEPSATLITSSEWTFENVELNKEYIAPQNSGVKLTFTKLPNPSGNIKIEEITLTEDQIKQTGSLSNKAYDITSNMKDGDFIYNLSLPIPESAKGKTVEVKFAEELSNIGTAEKVENTLTKTDTSVSVNSLDHFTIYVLTTPNPDSGQGLVINEIFVNPVSGNEFVEIYNMTNSDYNCSFGVNCRISDATGPEIIFTNIIPAHGFYVFEHAQGWLNNTGPETVILKDYGNNEIDRVEIQAAGLVGSVVNHYPLQGESLMRITDGNATWSYMLGYPTKGRTNVAGQPVVNNLYVSGMGVSEKIYASFVTNNSTVSKCYLTTGYNPFTFDGAVELPGALTLSPDGSTGDCYATGVNLSAASEIGKIKVFVDYCTRGTCSKFPSATENLISGTILDNTGPVNVSTSYATGLLNVLYTESNLMPIGISNYSDTGVGGATAMMYMESAPYINGVCGTFTQLPDSGQYMSPGSIGGVWSDNGNSYWYSNLDDGLCHRLNLVASDMFGNTTTYTGGTVMFDTQVSIPTVTAGVRSIALAYFAWNLITNDNSGINHYEYAFTQAQNDGIVPALWTSVPNTQSEALINAATYGYYTSPGNFLGITPNWLHIRAIDNAGNVGSERVVQMILDFIAPNITITNPNTSEAQSKTITAVTDEGSLSMSINAAGASTCNGSLTFVPYTSTTFHLASDNTRTICYRAVDVLGNTSYLVSNPISGIDTTPPVITIDSYNTNWTNQNITVTALTNEGTLNTTSHLFSANGSFDFVATDSAGNSTTQTVTITNIDKGNPDNPGTPTASPASPTNQTLITWTWTAATDAISGVKQYAWRLWKGLVNVLSGTTTDTFKTFELSSFGDGDYSFNLLAVDYVDNMSAIMTSNVTTVDTGLPAVVSVDSDGQTYNLASSNPVIKVTFSEDIENTPTVDAPTTGGAMVLNNCSDTNLKTFCFTYPLPPLEAIETLMISGAQDIAGNEMVADSTHTFHIDRIAPTITGITTSTANGAYTIGQVIDFSVTFSEVVNVSGGTPEFIVNPAPGRKAFYVSGNGSTTLVFNYTVVAGDNANDLTHINETMTLNGATIKDAAGNNAVTTLPDHNIFGAAHSITIDTTAPIITITNPDTSSAQSKTVTAVTNEGILTMSINAAGVSTCNGSLTFVPYASTTFSLASDNTRTICYRAVDIAGNTIYSVSSPIAGIDTTAPTVVPGSYAPTGLISGNNPNLQIRFTDNVGFDASNKLANIVSYKIDNVSQTTNTGCITISGAGDINFAYSCTTGVLSNGVHSIDFQVKDLSGNISSNVNWTFTVDTIAPTIASVDSDGQTFNIADMPSQTIKVTFSENIANMPTIAINPPVQSQTVNDCNDDDTRTFCFDYALVTGQEVTHTIYISNAQDVAGNIMIQDSAHTFVVDTKSPVITGTFTRQSTSPYNYAKVGDIVRVDFESNERVYPQNMEIAGHTIGSYSPQNAEGTRFYIYYTMQSSDTEGPLTYSLTAQDDAGNSTTITGGGVTFDKTAPTISFTQNVDLGPTQSDVVIINVSDTNLSSYNYGFSSDNICNSSDTYDKSFTSGSAITFINEDHNGQYICVKALDSAGNDTYIGSANDLNIDVTPPQLTSAETRDTDDNGKIDVIKLTFNENINDSWLAASGADGWAVNGYSINRVDTGSVGNDNILLLYLNESSTLDTGIIPTVTYTKQLLLNSTHDAAGNQLESITYDGMTDNAKPILLSAETQDTNGNGKIDAIKLTFSENIDDEMLNVGEADGWNVDGYDGESIGTGDVANDNILVLKINEGLSNDDDATPTITYTPSSPPNPPQSTHDMAGNQLAYYSDPTIDNASPTPVNNSTGGGGGGGAGDGRSDGLGCANHDCSSSQGQVLGVSAGSATLGLAYVPDTEEVLDSQEVKEEVLGTENAKEKAASDEEENYVSAFQNPIADATNWVSSHKKISLLTILILGGIIFFLYRRRKRAK